MDNRKTRRAKKSLFNKQLKSAVFDSFEDISDNPGVREKLSSVGIGEFVGFYTNSIYSVQVYKRNNAIFAGIRRHDQKPSYPWTDRQKIKNSLFGDHAVFVEYMPPSSLEVDQANMYWIYTSEKIMEAFFECNLSKRRVTSE